MSGTVSATTSIFTPSSTNYTPQNEDLNVIVFGNYEGKTGYVTSDEVYFGTTAHASAAAGTITFNGTSSNPAGVYQGYTNNTWAPSPSSGNTAATSITTDYIAAEPNNSVTISFNQTEEYFGLLWGSINASNELQFYNGTTLVATVQAVSSGNKLYLETTVNGQTTQSLVTSENTYYVSVNIPGGYTSVTASSASGAFEFANVAYAATTVTANPLTQSGNGAKIITPYDSANNQPMCFLEGTMIATPGGARLVETLRQGDLVLTASGQVEPVSWIGVRKMAARFADKLRAFPVRIAAGALADGIPARDLLLSPEHALLIDGILINAGALVNDVSITRETKMPESFTYYHVELASHALIMAENAAAETFLDNADRMHFDNWNTHPGQPVITEMNLPRAKAARQVPASIRNRLLARAAAFTCTSQAA